MMGHSMCITIEVSDRQSEVLSRIALRRGVQLDELCRLELEKLIERENQFERASQYTLKKNAELYRRLAQ
jgi:antitoxin FitA